MKLECAKKHWTDCRRPKKVLFSDESYFFVQGKHSRFFRIRKGEQLSPAHFNEVVKDPQIRCSGAVYLFSRRFAYMSFE